MPAWLVYWDAPGIVCASLTYFFIGWAGYQISGFLSPMSDPLSACHSVVFYSLLAMGAWSHHTAMCTNPGAVEPIPKLCAYAAKHASTGDVYDVIDKRNPEQRDGEWVTTCTRCPAYRPLRAHHCSVCGRCIRRMDHHCPWVNNCVGEDNQKAFMLFTVYICLSSAYGLTLTLTRGYNVLFGCDDDACDNSSGVLVFIFLLLECALFSLFTLIIFCDQLCSVMSDSSVIDRKFHGSSDFSDLETGRWANIKRVFGRDLSWQWLVPRCSNALSRAPARTPTGRPDTA